MYPIKPMAVIHPSNTRHVTLQDLERGDLTAEGVVLFTGVDGHPTYTTPSGTFYLGSEKVLVLARLDPEVLLAVCQAYHQSRTA